MKNLKSQCFFFGIFRFLAMASVTLGPTTQDKRKELNNKRVLFGRGVTP